MTVGVALTWREGRIGARLFAGPFAVGWVERRTSGRWQARLCINPGDTGPGNFETASDARHALLAAVRAALGGEASNGSSGA